MTSGVIVVFKERGWTSFDVVARLRKIMNQKKIGHTGTLDPDAEGVLPVCLGRATHLVEDLSHGTKSYRCTMLLGVTTDTQDAGGTVLSESPVCVTEEEVRRAVLSFQGKQKQIPPMYSALKVNGKKLVDLARRGIEVERKPRDVEFHEIRVLEICLPGNFHENEKQEADVLPGAQQSGKAEVTFEVTCSHGTYIRTLCHDIGQKLGCGACMKSLLRTKVEEFTLDDAMKLNEIERLKREEDERNGRDAGPYSFVIPVDHFYEKLPAYEVFPDFLMRAVAGNPVPWDEVRRIRDEHQQTPDDRVRLYAPDGKFIGIYRRDRDGLRLEKYFYEDHS